MKVTSNIRRSHFDNSSEAPNVELSSECIVFGGVKEEGHYVLFEGRLLRDMKASAVMFPGEYRFEMWSVKIDEFQNEE